MMSQLIVTKSPGNTGIGLVSFCPAKRVLADGLRSPVDPTVSDVMILKDFVRVNFASPKVPAVALSEEVITPVDFWS